MSPLRRRDRRAEPARHTRILAVNRVASTLERESYPRALMLGFVTLAGLTGFLSAVGLLAAGVVTPAIRYPLAALVGYGAFLLAIRLWLGTYRNDTSSGNVDIGPASAPDPSPTEVFGGGGGFSGAGSAGDFAGATEAKSSIIEGAVEVVSDSDESIVVVAPVLLAVAIIIGIGASASVLWQAPMLLAEVLVDGAVAAVVYQRVRSRPASHWSTAVWRRTWKPALALLAALTAFGALIPWLVPGADSIGDLFR